MPFNPGNSTNFSLPYLQISLYLYLSSPPISQFKKVFLLPKANHSTYIQDPLPFHLVGNLIHDCSFLSRVVNLFPVYESSPQTFICGQSFSHLTKKKALSQLPTFCSPLSLPNFPKQLCIILVCICFPILSSIYFSQSWT